MQITPLESWISRKIFGSSGHPLPDDAIRGYHLERLRQTIDYARDKSPYYRERLREMSSESLQDPGDLSAFPFTTVEDLREQAPRFLCVSQSEVERVVTIPSPDGMEKPRRLYFTGADLELTIDFFHHGMTTLVKPGQKVLILLAGKKPGSVGQLLTTALARADAHGIVHGIVVDPDKTIHTIMDQDIDCLVGIPTQLLALARHENVGTIPAGRLKSVLLVGDYVPSALVAELRRVWGCPVFSGYTPAIMGYGGGVECEALAGYHLREADIYYEIVDPISGTPQAPGELGEIVVTTLTRTAMPFIRYRTSDISRFLTEPCPCGTLLRRMDKVRGRANEMARLKGGEWLGIADVDEALFHVPGIVNYYATVTRSVREDRLDIVICTSSDGNRPSSETIASALHGVRVIKDAVRKGDLILAPVSFTIENRVTTCAVKRAIVQKQGEE